MLAQARRDIEADRAGATRSRNVGHASSPQPGSTPTQRGRVARPGAGDGANSTRAAQEQPRQRPQALRKAATIRWARMMAAREAQAVAWAGDLRRLLLSQIWLNEVLSTLAHDGFDRRWATREELEIDEVSSSCRPDRPAVSRDARAADSQSSFRPRRRAETAKRWSSLTHSQRHPKVPSPRAPDLVLLTDLIHTTRMPQSCRARDPPAVCGARATRATRPARHAASRGHVENTAVGPPSLR